MSEKYDVVVVGAGQAGSQAAIQLREKGFRGSIALIGAENELPYERPPLTKEYLGGEFQFERLLIRPTKFWEENSINVIVGHMIMTVRPESTEVVAENGTRFGYNKLIWAAGGVPRRLSCPGSQLDGICSIRDRVDVDRILAALPGVAQVVVIGGGYIGLETAATLTKLGKRIVLLESQDRVLARVAGVPLSRFLEAEHRAAGVDIRLSAAVDSFIGENGKVNGVRLSTAEIIPAELVIVGVGISPSVEPLIAAGAEGENGIRVDSSCRSSIPSVYAIGDCAEHPNSFANGKVVRLESIQNANDQAATVADAIVNGSSTYQTVPWFWSNQYALRLQSAGLSIGHDAYVVRGNPESRSFSIIYLRDGRVIALDCVNATKDFLQGKSLIESGMRPDVAALEDVSVPLKRLAAQQSTTV